MLTVFSTLIFPIRSWVFALCVQTKKGHYKNSQVYMWGIPRPTRFNQHWHLSKRHWGNQSSQVWQRSVEGVQSYGGSNFALLHRNCLSPVEMWQSLNSNSTMFVLRTFITDSKFDECLNASLWSANSWENPCSMTDFICRERIQTFFLKFNLSHKLQLLSVQHNFCSVLCYTVLI